jgi:hypothetical protein
VTILRSEHRADFTIVPNEVFVDRRLSAEAKGVLGYLLSRPHNWHVRLDHVGRTLLIGRKKLQRIFRELIRAGYVSREQRRGPDDHRFDRADYVVRDVPEAIGCPVDKRQEPQVRKRPTAPGGQVLPPDGESSQPPWGLKEPAYKELNNKRLKGKWPAETRRRLPGVAGDRIQYGCTQNQDAACDFEIVAMFRDPALGWGLLCVLPDEVLHQVREWKRQGDLDERTLGELLDRYRHLLRGGSSKY